LGFDLLQRVAQSPVERELAVPEESQWFGLEQEFVEQEPVERPICQRTLQVWAEYHHEVHQLAVPKKLLE
jgi:hypothetical protein